MNATKKTCDTCGGSGEIGFFQGESRFFITRDECPACCGFGYVLDDADPGADRPAAETANEADEETP